MQFLANTSEDEELSVPSPRQRRYRSLDQNRPIFLRKSEGATRLTLKTSTLKIVLQPCPLI